MDFGVNLFPVLSPAEKSASDYFDESLGMVGLAERLGFEHVQIVEHHGSPYGGYSPDPVTFLAAAARSTSRIRLATGAVIPAFIHPVKLAGKLAMLDNLCHGRLDVGFGRAFLPDEFELFGVPMAESHARFTEGIEACRRLWSEQDVVWDGPFHRFGPVTLLPRPVQRPHPPIFVASATSPDTCAAAGKAGHFLQAVPSVTTTGRLQEMLTAYREARAAAGHDPAATRIQIKYTCYLSADRAEALRTGETYERNYVAKMGEAIRSWATTRSAQYPGYEKFVDKVAGYDFGRSLADDKVLAGTPDDVRGQLDRIAERFGDDVTVSLQFNPGYLPVGQARAAMEMFARHFMPVSAAVPVP
ncbi:LLM class flavin-dependent oxidoreductase [Amycolatopsis sp. NPDC059027]|uniref:LLM class flavin-dependent oxidoreductase n=1 Tax=unclassified Amycolatopsis TaxID=2618356 RepID=UPI00366FED6A